MPSAVGTCHFEILTHKETKMPMIRIQMNERVSYDQTVKLSKKDWEKVRKLPPKEACEWLYELLRKDDCDGEGPDHWDGFEAFAVGPDNKRLETADEYVGA